MIASLLLATASVASAQGEDVDWTNKQSQYGLGVTQTIGGAAGLAIHTYVTPEIGVHGTIGFDLQNLVIDPAVDETAKLNDLNIGLYASYKLKTWQRGHLSPIGGIDIETFNSSVTIGGTTTSDTGTNLLIGLGFMGEAFLSEHFSIHAQTGLRLDFIGGDAGGAGIDFNGADPSGFALSLDAELLGAAGITVWF